MSKFDLAYLKLRPITGLIDVELYAGLVLTGRQLLEQDWTDEDRAAFERRSAEFGEMLRELEERRRDLSEAERNFEDKFREG